VRLDEPAWWYGSPGGVTELLMRPAGVVWGHLAQRRFARAAPYQSSKPVICVGNFTAGGTGKTPLALCVARELGRLGRKPAFLSRGYGGRLAGPQWVAVESDTADAVGDEPLLLARLAPTLIARDRAAGARAIEGRGPVHDVIVMDDGLQNPSLAKDLVLAVIDGRRGIGNGRVMPAGPLRAPLEFQLGLADAIVVNEPPGQSDGTVSATADWLRQRFPGPVLTAGVRPSGSTDWLAGTAVVAYAGIGAPQRFFDLIARLGADVRRTLAFADHYNYSDADAESLLALAEAHAALLVTTEKDLVRLPTAGAAVSRLRAASRPLPVELALEERDGSRLEALLNMALKAHDQRRRA
jgi:tetraacyldisaccharide 4'-kinase